MAVVTPFTMSKSTVLLSVVLNPKSVGQAGASVGQNLWCISSISQLSTSDLRFVFR